GIDIPIPKNLPPDARFVPNPNPTSTCTKYFDLQVMRFRDEKELAPDLRLITIVDVPKHKCVMINENGRKAFVHDLAEPRVLVNGKNPGKATPINGSFLLEMETLRRVKDAKLTEEKLHGRDVFLYRSEHKGPESTLSSVTMTYWFNSKTKLPVQVET